MRIQQAGPSPSIYQRAFPFFPDRIDLDQLGEDPGIGEALLQHLLEGKPPLSFTPSTASLSKIQHLYVEVRHAEKIEGPNPLGVGFPLIYIAEGDDLLLAPLFIWPLQLEPGLGSTRTWVLKAPQDASYQWNQFLLDMLTYRKGEEIVQHIKKLVGDEPVTLPTLFRISRSIAGFFEMADIPTSFELEAFPNLEYLSNLKGAGQIIPSAILGLYPLQPVLPAVNEESLQQYFSQEQLEAPGERRQPFGIKTLAPASASAFEGSIRQKTTLITDGNKADRLDLLANVLFNALSNGERTLVISDKTNTLLEAEEYCKQEGLGNLLLTLKNRQQDKVLLLEILKSLPERLEHMQESPEGFKVLLNRSLRNKEKLDAAYQAVRPPLMAPHNWTELVGLFLKNNRIESKGLLGSQLQASEYTFDREEYKVLLHAMEMSMPLYEQVNTLKHPLAALHPSIFLQKTKQEGLNYVRDKIAQFQEKLEELHYQFIQHTDSYAIRLNGFYEKSYLSLYSRANHLRDRLADLNTQYGENFEKSGLQTLKLKGLVSSKAKEMLSVKEQLAAEYNALVAQFQEETLFDYTFEPSQEGKNVAKVRHNMDHFLETLQDWRNQIPSLVQEEVSRLSLKSANPELQMLEIFRKLEQGLEEIIGEVNDAKLHADLWEDKMLTLPKKQRLLEQFIERLETTSLNLRDFDTFFDWQRNWLSLSPLAQKTFRALIKVKPDDWVAAFNSWYYHHFLNKRYSDYLPQSSDALKELYKDLTAFQPMLLVQLQLDWADRQESMLKKFRRSDKRLFQQLFGKGNLSDPNNKELEKIFQAGLDAVTETIPVLFMPYQLAVATLPKREMFFDQVIFLETSHLPAEQMGALAKLGKRSVIIAADDKDHSKKSLTRFLLKQEHPVYSLRGDLPLEEPSEHWDFQMLPLEKIRETKVFPVNGAYEELKGINEREADQVIHLLNQVQPTPQRTYPRVGIVAFTAEQRDHIAMQLLSIKQSNQTGSERIKQLERNGLLVVTPEELTGLPFEQLILSLTFTGSVEKQGKEHEQDRQLPLFDGPTIEHLLHHESKKISVVHSFAEETLDSWYQSHQENGSKLIAQYLQAVSALRQGETGRAQGLANQLFQLPKVNIPESIFPEEVKEALRPYFDPERFLEEAIVAGIHLPLRISSSVPSGPVWTIIPDLFLANTPYTSYRWEYEKKIALKEANHRVLHIWSAHWWRNPRQEARKLAGRIIQLDNSYQKQLKQEAPSPGGGSE